MALNSYIELIGLFLTAPQTQDALPLRTAVPIDWAAGFTGQISCRLVDQDGQPVILNLTGGDFIKLNLSFGPGARFKQFVGAAAATVFSNPNRAARNQYIFTLAATDTSSLQPGSMVYDVWASLGGVLQQVVEAGYFVIKPQLLI